MNKHLRFLLAALLCVFAGSVVLAQNASDDYLNPLNYATIDEVGFNTNVIDNLYAFDEGTSTLVVSVYGAYQSMANGQNWITVDGSGSTSRTWDAPSGSVFKGSTYYHTSTTAKCATGNTSRKYMFTVTNVVSVSALVKSGGTSRSAVMTVMEGTEEVGTVSDNTNSVAVLSIDDLDASKTYVVTLTGDNSNNSDLYEVAFKAASGKTPVTMSFPEDSYEADYDEGTFEAPTLTINPSGLTVTYSSSDESVATVDVNTGAVTIVGVGPTTITAEYAGDDSYDAASASYTLNVVSSNLIPVSDFMWNFSTWDATSYSATTIVNNLELIPADGKTITIDGNNKSMDGYSFSKRLKFAGTGDTTKNTVHFKVSGSCLITVYGMSSSSSATRPLAINANGVEETTDFSGDQLYKAEYAYAGNATDVYVYSTNSGINLYGIKVEPLATEKVVIGERGAVSFSCTEALDFTDSDVQAYIVTEKNGSSFTKKQVTIVPANTGLVIEGAEGEYELLIAAADAEFDDVEDNLLVATSTGEYTVTDETYDRVYGLFYSTTKEQVGFQKKKAGYTFGVDKCYLLLPEGSSAKGLEEFFFDGTTGIDTTFNVQRSTLNVYNLNGQRVDSNYKGVVIVNGKKVIKK